MLKKLLTGIGVGAVMLAATLQPAEAARIEQFVHYNSAWPTMVTAEAIAYHTSEGCFMYINGFQYDGNDFGSLSREGEVRTVAGNTPYVAVYGLLRSVQNGGQFGELDVETANAFHVPWAFGYTAEVNSGVNIPVSGYAGYLYDFYLGTDAEHEQFSEVLGGFYQKPDLSEEQRDEQQLSGPRLNGGMAAYMVKMLRKAQMRYRNIDPNELHFDYAGVATEYEYPELQGSTYYLVEVTNDNQEVLDSYLVHPKLNRIYLLNGGNPEILYAEQEL